MGRFTSRFKTMRPRGGSASSSYVVEDQESEGRITTETPATDQEIAVVEALKGLSRSGWVGLDGLSVSQLVKKGASLPALGATSFFADGDYVVEIRQRIRNGYDMRKAYVPPGYGVEASKAVDFLQDQPTEWLKAHGLK